jgi:3-oxoacyl-[acyl-carrier protein] reductase
MDLGLNDKVALVAGGSRGCGLAIASELAREGCAVILTGREPEHVERAVAGIEKDKGRVHGIVGDMSDEADATRIAAEAAARFGSPDILVINPPSASQARLLAGVSDEDLRRAFEIWVLSITYLARPLLPAMIEKGWGRIIYIGSIGMKMLHLEDPMYAQNVRVAAAGIIKTMAHEYGRSGITANCIATGPFLTDLTRSYMEADEALSEDHMLGATAAGRWGRPEEMGAVIAFLASTRAGYVSGETIRVDGGYTHNLF